MRCILLEVKDFVTLTTQDWQKIIAKSKMWPEKKFYQFKINIYPF